MPTPLPIVEEQPYICPGESHPISRAVHLSRLAAFYPGCRDCALRDEDEVLPRRTAKKIGRSRERITRSSLLTDEGFRGVYVNELTRRKAHLIAAAFAGRLWKRTPRIGPRVVVGRDERASSPDIATGVTEGLLRMGCRIVDVGVVTKPCLWFAVDHLAADAGVFVTGGGCDPSWTGLDLCTSQGPVSRTDNEDELRLQDIEAHIRDPYDRPTRESGDYRTFRANIPYEAGLLKHFRDAQPLTVVAATSSRTVTRLLERTFQDLPCRCVPISLPARKRNLSQSDDPDILRTASVTREQRADLGVLIADDGQHCAFFDGSGTRLSSDAVTKIIADHVRKESPAAEFLLDLPAGEDICRELQRRSTIHRCGPTLADAAQAMRHSGAAFGGGGSGRYWFGESFPTCDALVALAKLLSTDRL